jgi:hypothetical protein
VWVACHPPRPRQPELNHTPSRAFLLQSALLPAVGMRQFTMFSNQPSTCGVTILSTLYRRKRVLISRQREGARFRHPLRVRETGPAGVVRSDCPNLREGEDSPGCPNDRIIRTPQEVCRHRRSVNVIPHHSLRRCRAGVGSRATMVGGLRSTSPTGFDELPAGCVLDGCRRGPTCGPSDGLFPGCEPWCRFMPLDTRVYGWTREGSLSGRL